MPRTEDSLNHGTAGKTGVIASFTLTTSKPEFSAESKAIAYGDYFKSFIATIPFGQMTRVIYEANAHEVVCRRNGAKWISIAQGWLDTVHPAESLINALHAIKSPGVCIAISMKICINLRAKIEKIAKIMSELSPVIRA